MRDYLINLGDDTAFDLPTGCDSLAVTAYSDDETPATPLDGNWYLVAICDGCELPSELLDSVVAEGTRNDGLRFPEGVAGLSTVWAGMDTTT